ncbi:MAG: polysaccharide pyruvyl transferase family protein [Caryophanon sp.]|nr:polysaccharide pyruvyl transferase family protein [Caryophanon sp.]
MKIGIVGNYGNDNNGDEAILYSLIQQVKEQFSVKSEDITVFSNNTQQTSERYGVKSYPLYYKRGNLYKTFFYTYKSNKRYMDGFDLLIIGGGGILMDFYRREAHLYSTYALMAKHSGVPYVVYGCGAGPLDTLTGKMMIRYMCKYAANVSVRDPESKELLRTIGVKRDIHVIGDPAFTMFKERNNHPDKPKRIGISAVPVHNANYWPSGDVDKYDNYVQSMAANLDELINEHDVDITFFATKYPQDVSVTKDIRNKMKRAEKVDIIDRNLIPEDLLQVTSELDVVIGTRLHSLILATDAQTPIIALSYHKKVTDFMRLIKSSDLCIELHDLPTDTRLVSKAFSRLTEDWDTTVERTKRISAHTHGEAMRGKQLLAKAVKDK